MQPANDAKACIDLLRDSLLQGCVYVQLLIIQALRTLGNCIMVEVRGPMSPAMHKGYSALTCLCAWES